VSEHGATRAEEALAAQDWRASGHLSLRGLDLRELPPFPPEALTLRSLDLSGNRLAEVPEQVWELAALERLDLASNHLTSLGPGIGRLTALRVLDVSENRLAALPAELANCKYLERLDLYGNRLEDLSPLAGLPALTDLDAAGNRLLSVEALPTPDSLAYLDLSGNGLAELPATLARLRALRRLDVSGNRMTSDNLTVLRSLPLEELYLDDNLLAQPPLELASLPLLRRFSATDNPFGELPPAALPAWSVVVPAVERAVWQRISGEADPSRQHVDAPTYSFDFELALDTPRDAHDVLDLYYKRFQDLPATLRTGDGASMRLGETSRRTALAHVAGAGAGLRAGRALFGIEPTKDRNAVRDVAAFVAQAVARLPRAELLTRRGTEPDISFHAEAEPIVGLRESGPAAAAPLPAVAAPEPPAEAEQTAVVESEPRVLNVAMADAERGLLSPDDTLAPARDHLVRIDVGPRSPDSVVANPVPFPADELEPSSPQGWWLGVVLSSSDVDVAADVHRVFLPFVGPSWVCVCNGSEHVCAADQRHSHLWVRIRTRDGGGPASLRCTVYDRNNAIQSLRLDFTVADDPIAGAAIRAVIDYSLAEDVGCAEALGSRGLHVLTNESTAGTHKIVVNDGTRAIAVDVGETQASEAFKALRTKLTEVTLGKDGETLQYDEHNVKPAAEFVKDLEGLARLGSQLLLAVLPDSDDRVYVLEQLHERTKIQISRVTKTTFPWALIYDIPRETDPPWQLCPLLEGWDQHRDQLSSYPASCPFGAPHDVNVLCPYGFWGFRHLIEQPPSVRAGVLRDRIMVTPPARAASARSLALDQALTTTHFDDLNVCLKDRFELDRCDTRDTLREAFGAPGLPLVYFYCHGRTAELAGTQMKMPFLEIGAGDRIAPGDFAAWNDAGGWGPEHWKATAPLVFINGCGTAALAPIP
jgi:Leucine-rich repeat (LRR) protein